MEYEDDHFIIITQTDTLYEGYLFDNFWISTGFSV